MFQAFLKQHDSASWQRTLAALLPGIHEVDRAATQIWFHFFPLELADAIADAADLAQLATALRLEGNFRLADQVDSSHWFLYGHAFWPQVKGVIIERAESLAAPSSLELAGVIRDVAADAVRRAADAGRRPADMSLLLGIAAVGVMTLQQVGLDAFRVDDVKGPAKAGQYAHAHNKSPEQIVAARRKNDGQGLAGMFRGIRAQYTVTFDERRREARFTVINQQHLTTASANDTRDYSKETRGTVEGPIPAQCRTASCGTCWVGILGGSDNLSAVDAHEKKRMKEFGYIDTPDSKPVIRLACQAIATGNVTIVIPPWNGFIGKRKGSRETSAAPQPR
jgi:ferredoxin